MSSKKNVKKLAGYKCQLCGDEDKRVYEQGVIVQLEAHHIIPFSKGGATKLHNLVALCDLCHAVVTPQRWEEYFGLKKNNISIKEMEELKAIYDDAIEDIRSEHKKLYGRKVPKT